MTATYQKSAWLAGVVLVLATLVLTLFWAYNQVEASAAARHQSTSVLDSASNVLSLLKDAETGQRGYLLTGDEVFLEPYTAATQKIKPELESLRQRGFTDGAKKHLDAVLPLVAAQLAGLSDLIERRHSASLSAVIQDLREGEGKRLMDSIRAEMAGFERLEQAALQAREAEFHLTMRRLFGVIIFGSVMALMLSSFIVLFIYRQIEQRYKTLVHLETKHLNEVLEAKNSQLNQLNLVLKDSEEKLAVTLNSIGDAVIATDAQACVTLLNPVAQLLTGWGLEDAVGRRVEEVFHIVNKDSRELATIPVGQALLHGTLQGLANHTVLISRNGTECDIADSCAPIRGADGELIGAVLVFRNVTKEYAAQQSLTDSSALIHTILNTVVDGIVTLHAGDSGIKTVNQAVEKMFGYTQTELGGKNFSMLIPELNQQGGKSALEHYLVSVSSLNREVAGRHKDGHLFPVEIAVSEMWLGGQRFFTGTLRDITSKKQIESDRNLLNQELLKKNAELEKTKFLAEKANRAKSEFLSSMSHELRTPLGAILGFSQLLASGSPLPTPSQQRSLDQILKAGWYLLELINEILDLTMIESGKMSLSLEPVSLIEVLRECESMIEPQAQKRGINLVFSQLKSPYFVLADRTRVKQVLLNLLSNAIKYNKVGGSVAVHCALRPPDSIRISVMDKGHGLNAEQLAQLFQPFNRLGQKAKDEEGTGIGLVVSKRLVELMNGAIGVSSTVGEGSEFWFDLVQTNQPRVDANVVEAGPHVLGQAKHPTQLPTLLYVEDNPANLMLVKDIIARRPEIRLLSAMDGHQGVEFARELLPDVILMDINLPGISGLQALEMLALDPSTARIPVVAVSANAMPRDIEKGLAAGFFRYLTKPIKVDEFLDTLDVALAFAKTQTTDNEKKEQS